MTRTSAGWLIALTLLGGGWAVFRVYIYATEAGDVFPEYSSLRADPKGSRAFHDSLQALPGMRVSRWFQRLEEIPSAEAAVLFLDMSPWSFRFAGEKKLEEWEKAAERGLRLVFALSPEPRMEPAKPKEELVIEKRWKISLKSGKKGGPVVLEAADPAWAQGDGTAERAFGKGSIALIAESYPFSNQSLREERDLKLLLWALGGHTEVIFDEYHLGSQQTGSIGVLLRRYRLEGAAFGLVALGLLFVWRMSASFVPPRPASEIAAVSGRDSAAAMSSLLRRNVPAAQLPAAARELWNHATQLLPGLSAERPASVERELAGATGDAPKLWRRIHEILTRRT